MNQKYERALYPHVVPGKRANGSRECAPADRLSERDPGSITTGGYFFGGWGSNQVSQRRPVVMGPCFRRDDEGGWRRTRPGTPRVTLRPHSAIAACTKPAGSAQNSRR